MDLHAFLSDVRHVGPLRACARSLYYKLDRSHRVSIFDCLIMDVADVNAAFLSGGGYVCRFLEPGELLALASRAENNLPHDFVAAALSKGDRCFAVLDGKVLANFGWYSNQPTRLLDDLVVHFDPAYVYMYRGFTRSEYRGLKLQGRGLARALQAFTNQGYRGLVTLADRVNYASLRSARRAGFRDCGTLYRFDLCGKTILRATAGCAEYGMRLARIAGTPS